MSTATRKLKDQAYRPVPLTALQRAMPRDVIGLVYHMVTDRPLPHVQHLYRYKSPEQFECDLLFLKQNFRLLGYAELLAAREAGTELDPPGVLLTFDDGYAECFSVARPLLLEHQVPCIFFVITESLDNRRLIARNKVSLCIERVRSMAPSEAQALYGELSRRGTPIADLRTFSVWIDSQGAEPLLDELCLRLGIDQEEYLATEQPFLTSEQLRVLADDGFTIGAHTRTHRRLGTIANPAVIEDEIVESCSFVAELLGRPSVPFAFPFSADGVDRKLLGSIRSRAPAVELMFDNKKLRQDLPWMVNRIGMDRPPADNSARSSVPERLRSAYLTQIGWNVRDAVRG